MALTVRVGPASDELVEEFVALSRTYYDASAATATDPSVVSWRHLQADTGPSVAIELIDGDDVVGRMWMQVRPWTVNGASIRAANPIDFLIREDHRKLPAFMSLFRSTMKTAEREADLVYHSSNPLTDDLYRKLMKLKPVTELDGAVLPVRPFAAAKAARVVNLSMLGTAGDVLTSLLVRLTGQVARLGGVRLTGSATAADQDRVVAAFEREEAVAGTRSALHRAWRFAGAKGISYDTRWIQIRGNVRGYIVTTDRDIDGIRGRFVVDLVLPQELSRLQRWSLWLQIAATAARQRQHAIFFFYNRQNDRLRHRAAAPLITVDRSRLPQQVPVFVRIHPSADSEVVDGVDWASGYFVLSDFDMF